jgi:hypothetical protein
MVDDFKRNVPALVGVEQFDSEFEMDVCEFLRENGFDVDTQVGCSGFRIDMPDL